MQGCNPAGGPLGLRQNEIIYCRSVSAALSKTKPQVYRVLASPGKQAHSLFVKAAMAELLLNQDETTGFPVPSTVTIARGTSCLPCTCAAALEHLSFIVEAEEKKKVV